VLVTERSVAFERVYTVCNYFDGPREGIADYRDRPHHYVCEWNNELDDYANTFTLAPVDSETMDLDLEQWKIGRTWEADFLSGMVPHETHPGFGGNDARYDLLKATVTARLAAIPRLSNPMRATFRPTEAAITLPPGQGRTLEVEWKDVDVPIGSISP
jgi:hypothetical protein